MSKTRIYEVARNLDRTSKEILAISNTLGFEAKAANSSLDQAQINAIENFLIPPEPKKKKSRKKFNQFENVSDELVSESSGQRQSENYGGMTKKEVKRYQKAQR
ncbi:MAG: translation initiation factor IF-2 N-terminal domain-containing protein, partial [Lactococcus raffinolactis]